MEKIVTVDIGGTNTRMALWQDGKIVRQDSLRSIAEDMDKTLLSVNRFIAESGPDAIGVSMPGPADFKNGIMFYVPNLAGWRNKSVKKVLAVAAKDAPIFFENDANLMALAHHKTMQLPDTAVTQFLTISTGLGAGLIINGRVFTGGMGYAQEVAWAPASVVSEPNELGHRSLEYFSAGGGLSKRARKHLGLASAKELFEAADKGSALARKIIEEGTDTLGTFLAIVFATINPSHLIVDGAVARHRPEYVKSALAKAQTMTAEEQRNVKLIIGDLGDNAALIGAYHLVKGSFDN